MTISKKITIILGYVFIALYSFIPQAQASGNVDLTNPAFATVTGRTSIPIGHSEFCKSRPAECGFNSNVQDIVELTQDRWNQLLAVNTAANTNIVAVTDEQLYQTVEFWTYPNGYGDCEDFVLAKRRDLIGLGWNPSTLLISVVKQVSGDGHAVLMVRTDRGDLILDNMEGLVKVWNQTPYQYIKRQSQTHAGQWVDIADRRPMSTIASL
ncbi:MAG: transglutaminase-like cysteine peptidase [Devosiaceae bacterium]|nr:transglutaminase-like cysteine peptidase [Devosiaceae bacterium]